MKKNILYDKYFWLINVTVIIITFLHYSTVMSKWEFHIFYRRLYYIPIILSAFKYRLKGGLLTSFIISILYAPHLMFNFNGFNIASINQYFEIILFLSIGLITGRLVEADYKKQQQLESKIIEITRLQNYTKNIVDSIESGVISVNNDFIITSVNREGEKILENMVKIGQKITSVIKDEKLYEALKQVKVQKKPVSNINIKLSYYEKEIYLEFKVFPLLDILNRIHGQVIVFEDKSKEKYLEAQTARADRLATVGELASGVAHEIRNPMGIIKTISQVLQDETEDLNMKEGLEIIEKEIDRANNVIQSLLNFAKPSTNVIERFSLDDFLNDIVLITEKYIKNHDIELSLKLTGNIEIMADKEKMKQVFINIILNSVQAMPKGGKLKIETSLLNEWLNIRFQDTGIGIPKDNLKKIFNPFFTTKEKGTGLGLSMVNRIIEDHGGYINVESTVNKGTKVDIFIPTKREGESSE